MYQFAEEAFGVKVVPGTIQTREGKAFTEGRKRGLKLESVKQRFVPEDEDEGEVGAKREDYQVVTFDGRRGAKIEILTRTSRPLQVGAMQIEWGQGIAAVTNVLVRKDFARQGIATLMYEEAAKIAEQHGLPLVSDTTRFPGAEAFWTKQVAKGRAEVVQLEDGQHPNQLLGAPQVYRLNYPPPDSLGAILPFDLRDPLRQPTSAQMIILYLIAPDLVTPYGALWQMMQLEAPETFAKAFRWPPERDDLLSLGIQLLPYQSQMRLALTYARWCMWVLEEVAPNEVPMAVEALQLAEDVLNEVVGEGQVDYMMDRIEPIRESRRQGANNPNYPVAAEGGPSPRRAQYRWSAAANVWDAIGTALHNEMGDWLYVASRGAISALRRADAAREIRTTRELAEIEDRNPSLMDAQLAMLADEIRRTQAEVSQESIGLVRRRGNHGS